MFFSLGKNWKNGHSGSFDLFLWSVLSAFQHRVPVAVVVCQLMIYSNVMVGITISFVFSQSRVEVSISRTNIGSLAVGVFDLVDCSLSVVRFVLVFVVGQ